MFVVRDTSLEKVIAQTLEGLGYELVALDRSARGRLIRVFVDRPGGISVDDCVTVSNQLTRVFAVENVEYDRLEVSSPGLDRPLRTADDFRRYEGEQARVRLRRPKDGRSNFEGTLRGCDGEAVLLDVEGVQFRFALSELERARLVPRF